MHEHIFIKNILENIPDKDNVIAIELELGELVEIEKEHLKEHLENEVPWKIIIKEIPSKIKCSCGYVGKANIIEKLHDIVLFECPLCKNDPEVLEGKVIKIKKITYK